MTRRKVENRPRTDRVPSPGCVDRAHPGIASATSRRFCPSGCQAVQRRHLADRPWLSQQNSTVNPISTSSRNVSRGACQQHKLYTMLSAATRQFQSALYLQSCAYVHFMKPHLRFLTVCSVPHPKDIHKKSFRQRNASANLPTP